jgi:hypothetical protein
VSKQIAVFMAAGCSFHGNAALMTVPAEANLFGDASGFNYRGSLIKIPEGDSRSYNSDRGWIVRMLWS